MRSKLRRNILSILGIASAVGLNSCTDDVHVRSAGIVAQADTTHITYDGSKTIWEYYASENIQPKLQNQVTWHAYLRKILELNPSIPNFCSIPAGKVLIIPNLDGRDNESQNSKYERD